MARAIQLIEPNTQQVLESFPLEAEELAYRKATEYEEMGLDVKIVRPTINETLADSLGASEDEKKALRSELDEEILSHDGGCMACVPEPEKEVTE